MQRVHQMILSEVGSNGLESARLKLKKTPITTVLKSDGRRVALTRAEDGTEKEELIEERRSEDFEFLKLPQGGAAPQTEDRTEPIQ